MKSFRTILVIHQTPIIRKGIRLLLERQDAWTVIVYEAESYWDAESLLAQVTWDAIVMDEAATRQYQRWRTYSIPYLMIYSEQDAALCETITKSGKNGYLPLSSAGRDLYEAMESLFAGTPFCVEAPKTTPKKTEEPALASMDELLTARELEVFKMILQELSNDEIARELHVSRRTVEGHKQNITKKLNVRGLVGLTRMGMDFGMI